MSLEQTLENLDISLDKLSPTAQKQLKSIQKLVQLLDLKDAQETRSFLVNSSLALGVLEFKQRLAESEFENKELDRISSRIERMEQLNLQKKNQIDVLKKKLSETEPIDAQLELEWTESMEILEMKKLEYQSRLAVMKDNLPENSVECSLDNIRLKYKKVEQLMNEYKEKQSKLDSFRHLPPDVNLALLKLQEKKAEYESFY